MSKIGFTGTRHGMTDQQKEAFCKLIESKEFVEFHHGDCVGADEQAHDLVDKLRKDGSKKIKIVGHPPKYAGSRAHCKFDFEFTPDDYLERNRHIVDATDLMIANPDTPEKMRSGTWSTVRYARKKGKRIYIIHKNGRVEVDA